jgi:hypothetical protein
VGPNSNADKQRNRNNQINPNHKQNRAEQARSNAAKKNDKNHAKTKQKQKNKTKQKNKPASTPEDNAQSSLAFSVSPSLAAAAGSACSTYIVDIVRTRKKKTKHEQNNTKPKIIQKQNKTETHLGAPSPCSRPRRHPWPLRCPHPWRRRRRDLHAVHK